MQPGTLSFNMYYADCGILSCGVLHAIRAGAPKADGFCCYASSYTSMNLRAMNHCKPTWVLFHETRINLHWINFCGFYKLVCIMVHYSQFLILPSKNCKTDHAEHINT